jgi:hypothetical protein
VRQRRIHVPRQIVIPTIQQVFEMKTGFRFALHHQAALKEQCIGILTPQRQPDEILERTPHRNVRIERRGSQPSRRDLECQRRGSIVDVQTKALAGQLAEPSGQRLPAQQMIYGKRHNVGGHSRGNGMQETGNKIRVMRHDSLHEMSAHSCHSKTTDGLICIKRNPQ